MQFKFSCSSLLANSRRSFSTRTKFLFAPRINSRSIRLTRTATVYQIRIAYDMAKSVNKRTPLGIDAFREKATPDPPLCWKKQRVQYKLVLLAKENIILDTLLGPKPEMVDLPFEPIYEETVVGSSAQSEREKNACNAQQKMNWQNKCPRSIKIGIMCQDKPWPLTDRKTVSLPYLSIGVEGRRILNCKKSHND